MASKKKPYPSASEPNASTEAQPSNNIIVPTNADNNDHDEDLEVEDLADGGLEVNLHDLGISAEDIQAMKRIDACLAERLHQAQQAQTPNWGSSSEGSVSSLDFTNTVFS